MKIGSFWCVCARLEAGKKLKSKSFRKKENSGCSVKDGLEVGNLELGRSLRLAVIQVREGTQESPGNCPGSTPDHLNQNIWRWDPDISSFKLP